MTGGRAARLSCVGALVSLVVGTSDAHAQNRPFPRGGGYAHGFASSRVSSADVASAYGAWKSKYLVQDCGDGTARVEFGDPRGSTVSEGLGYGMILAAYMGDRPAFEGLLKFVVKNLNPQTRLVGWKVTCSGAVAEGGGANSATDGDEDIGLGLVAAGDQWGDVYHRAAIDYLATLKKVDFTSCSPSGRNMSKAGNWGGGCDHSNTSYFAPAFYRVFAEVTGDPFWSKAADDAVALWLVTRNPRTGLIGNEVDQAGVVVGDQSYVDYNGCRIPWRAVVDYLWYGTPGSKDVTDKLTDWASTVGISHLVDGYAIDGTPRGKYTQHNAWVGGWACGAMSKSQQVVDDFAADFRSIANDNGGYYGASLRVLYLLALSGNFWKPGTTPLVHATESATAAASARAPEATPWDGPPTTRSSCRCELAPNRNAPSSGGLLALLGSSLVSMRARRRRPARR